MSNWLLGLDWLALILLALAVARFTGLITNDTVLDPVRERLVYRRGDNPNPQPRRILADFIDCQWCVSIWVAAGVIAAVHSWEHQIWLWLVVGALAFSQITGMLSRLGR